MINIRQNKGFALIFSLIFLFLVISFMAVYILAVANGVSEANRVANEKRAYYIADAGLADAYERITQAGINTIPTTNSYIPSATTDNGVYSVGTVNGNYTVAVTYSNNPRTNYTITSTGTYGNVSKTLQLKMIGAAISKYAYWSQTELNPTYGQLWWVGIGVPNAAGSFVMVTTGPVQTDGTLNIFGNPIFDGKVTEANGDGGATPNYYYGTTSVPYGLQSDPTEIFPDGITNNAPQINLPAAATLGALETVASDGSGLVLTGASTVIFNPSGTITVTGTVKDSTGTVTTTYNNTTIGIPQNGVIYVQSNCVITKNCPPANPVSGVIYGPQDGNVTVQGTLNGQLTVAADQNINISGNVAYYDNPRIDSTSLDMLGLVANQNITVIQASAVANDGGPQLELSAVMVALQGSFQVDQWWVNMGNANTAVMDQFGSLINYVCGVTGEMDMSGDLLGGWNQIQSYDARLAKLAPPGFPPYVNNAGDGVYTKLSIAECLPSGLSCG